MAELSDPGDGRVEVRAPAPGDGRRLADLWRLLWDVHEGWGSYPGTREERVYDELAARLSEEARSRGASAVSGRHVHLVASVRGEAVGQVEGWLDRHGSTRAVRWTCEVRSLVVSEDARHLGAARALLGRLAGVAGELTVGAPAVLAAEVLEGNPAMAFYRKLGFRTPSYAVRLPTEAARALPFPAPLARLARPRDALALTFLEANLAERRRAAGDCRFDPPRALDAAVVDAIAKHLEGAEPRQRLDPADLAVVDARGVARASGTLTFANLEPPFLPGVRAILARVSHDACVSAVEALGPLVRLAGQLAHLAGAQHLEIVDLPGPRTALYEAARGLGATPWSRVALRDVG
ncbi:MAG TPA: GNAT family N-acetyltransferase [Polyangiaceae bacterium]|nr:GNAT family N-acetyltransferase [Polyangiaceae bacterium]